MSDHVHERGRRESMQPRGSEPRYECIACGRHYTLDWWRGHDKAIATIMANGLPDHERRLEVAGKEVWRATRPWHGSLAGNIIAAYHAPLPKEE